METLIDELEHCQEYSDLNVADCELLVSYRREIMEIYKRENFAEKDSGGD